MTQTDNWADWLPMIRISDFSVLVHEGPLYGGCGLAKILRKLKSDQAYVVFLYNSKGTKRELSTTVILNRNLEGCVTVVNFLEYGKPYHECEINAVEEFLVHILDLIEHRK